jgi:four helix bundle protein
VLRLCSDAIKKNHKKQQHGSTAKLQHFSKEDQMKIERFEDIQGWQEARKLTKKVYELTNRFPFKKDRGLCSQIQQASVFIMANIAEGFDRQSKKEFSKFLNYASASGSEVQSHLYVALDQEYISEQEFMLVYEQTRKTKSLINGFISYLKGKKK